MSSSQKRRPIHINEGNVEVPTSVDGQQTGSSSSRSYQTTPAPAHSQRRTRHEKGTRKSNVPRILKAHPGQHPHSDASSRRSQHTHSYNVSRRSVVVGHDSVVQSSSGQFSRPSMPVHGISIPSDRKLIEWSHVSTSQSKDSETPICGAAAHAGVDLQHTPPLISQSVLGDREQRGRGKTAERDQGVHHTIRETSYEKGALMAEMPGPRQLRETTQPPGTTFSGMIAPPQRHRKRPGADLQLETSKCLPHSDLRTPPAPSSLRLGSEKPAQGTFLTTVDSSVNEHPRKHGKCPTTGVQLKSRKYSPSNIEKTILPPLTSSKKPTYLPRNSSCKYIDCSQNCSTKYWWELNLGAALHLEVDTCESNILALHKCWYYRTLETGMIENSYHASCFVRAWPASAVCCKGFTSCTLKQWSRNPPYIAGAISVGNGCGFGDNWLMCPHVRKLSQVGKMTHCHGSV